MTFIYLKIMVFCRYLQRNNLIILAKNYIISAFNDARKNIHPVYIMSKITSHVKKHQVAIGCIGVYLMIKINGLISYQEYFQVQIKWDTVIASFVLICVIVDIPTLKLVIFGVLNIYLQLFSKKDVSTVNLHTHMFVCSPIM